MADSYVLMVEKALSELIANQITIMNGSSVELHGAVFRGRVRFGHNEPCPMISVMQAPNLDIESNSVGDTRVRTEDKVYLIQGWVPDDFENPTDPAHSLLAELKKVFALVLDEESPYYMLKHAHPDGLDMIAGLKVASGLVRPPEQGVSDKAYFWLPITITLIESIADPFAVP